MAQPTQPMTLRELLRSIPEEVELDARVTIDFGGDDLRPVVRIDWFRDEDRDGRYEGSGIHLVPGPQDAD